MLYSCEKAKHQFSLAYGILTVRLLMGGGKGDESLLIAVYSSTRSNLRHYLVLADWSPKGNQFNSGSSPEVGAIISMEIVISRNVLMLP